MLPIIESEGSFVARTRGRGLGWALFVTVATSSAASFGADVPVADVAGVSAGASVTVAPANPPAPAPAPEPPAPATPHPTPGLKLAYRTFSIANLDLTPLPLAGLELDLYPISGRWLRGGFMAAAGKGRARMVGEDVGLRYGLLGVAAGLQYPARLTPFVEGTLSGGVLAGTVDSALNIP